MVGRWWERFWDGWAEFWTSGAAFTLLWLVLLIVLLVR